GPGVLAVVRRAGAADPEAHTGPAAGARPATRGRGVDRGAEPTVRGAGDVDRDLLRRDVRAVDPVLGRAAPGPERLVLGMETHRLGRDPDVAAAVVIERAPARDDVAAHRHLDGALRLRCARVGAERAVGAYLRVDRVGHVRARRVRSRAQREEALLADDRRITR